MPDGAIARHCRALAGQNIARHQVVGSASAPGHQSVEPGGRINVEHVHFDRVRNKVAVVGNDGEFMTGRRQMHREVGALVRDMPQGGLTGAPCPRPIDKTVHTSTRKKQTDAPFVFGVMTQAYRTVTVIFIFG